MTEQDKKDESKQSEHLSKILFEARKVFVTGPINMEMATEICARLHAMSHVSDDPITMIICSPGGHVEAGDMIHDTIKFIKPAVKVVGTGYVASAGALIYVAADKENRFTTPNTRFLLHQPSGGVGGDASNIEIQANQIVVMRERLNRIFAEATGQTFEKIDADVDRDFWLTATEAKEYGLVHKIIENQDEIK
ncbi:ATP-dependent Clp protease proteolytic subunit [Kordiimonas sp. SCSIO 12603]|uniref:ATP-dependent Clp protease proteolytic subunit n=1 Tax=Kordiimonas sp. SCSIO 12603 TaxID=2829596 RepID=UPI0021067A7F|nr:ATP-dependent Clp protease proteolytic subunit [Kordiimonas sp. SCSIO 12603]UTW57321.1 ATP-dependent Clp protease proteolytic subunit [Kordiimonas sp. SCSIO 12603]